MKIFNKVLALVLALFTLVSVLPMSVFAADTWADVNTEVDGDNGAKVTLTLDAGTLAEILERDGISADLLQSLKSGISVDVAALREAFSVQDLFDIIPRDKWLEVFKLNEIVEELGLEEMLGYVDDLPALLKEVLSDDASMAKLEALLSDIDDLETCFNDLVLLQKHYLIPKDSAIDEETLILNHISDENKERIIALVQNDAEKRALLVDYFDHLILDDQDFRFADLEKILYMDRILKANEPLIEADKVIDNTKAAAEIQKLIANGNTNDLVDWVYTDKVITYLEGKYSDLSVLSSYVTLNAAGTAIERIEAEALLRDGKVTPSELMNNDLVDALGIVNLIGLENVIDMDKAKTEVLNADHAKLRFLMLLFPHHP